MVMRLVNTSPIYTKWDFSEKIARFRIFVLVPVVFKKIADFPKSDKKFQKIRKQGQRIIRQKWMDFLIFLYFSNGYIDFLYVIICFLCYAFLSSFLSVIFSIVLNCIKISYAFLSFIFSIHVYFLQKKSGFQLNSLSFFLIIFTMCYRILDKKIDNYFLKFLFLKMLFNYFFNYF